MDPMDEMKNHQEKPIWDRMKLIEFTYNKDMNLAEKIVWWLWGGDVFVGGIPVIRLVIALTILNIIY